MDSKRKDMLEALEKRPMMILARENTPKLVLKLVAWLDAKRGANACEKHIERLMCDCASFEATEYAFLEGFLNEDYMVSLKNCIKLKEKNIQVINSIKSEGINSVKQKVRVERQTLSNKTKEESEYKKYIDALIECDEFINSAKGIVAERVIAARKYTEEYICNYVRMLKGIDIDLPKLTFSDFALEHFESAHAENDNIRKYIIKSLIEKEN